MIQSEQEVFRALADGHRRDILVHLRARDMTIEEVCQRMPMTRTAVKKHLTILEEGHLISVHKRGRERLNRLEPLAMRSVIDWLSYFSGFWDEKLSKLEKAIEKERKENE